MSREEVPEVAWQPTCGAAFALPRAPPLESVAIGCQRVPEASIRQLHTSSVAPGVVTLEAGIQQANALTSARSRGSAILGGRLVSIGLGLEHVSGVHT
jgi:hypothetical protein